jgi:hypothetical protein
MALHLYNHLKPSFTHSAYITLGLDEGSSNTAKHLKAILKQLGMTCVSSSDPALLLSKQLHDALSERQILLVLDNVSEYQQLEALLPLQVAQGSVIIVTSRQKDMPEYNMWHQVSSQRHVRRSSAACCVEHCSTI